MLSNMTAVSPNTLGRMSAALLGTGVLVGLVTMAAPWLHVELPGGLSATGGWGQIAPASWSIGLAAVTAWGAGILVRGTPRRLLGILQSALASVALVLLLIQTSNTPVLAEQIASEALGIGGAVSGSELVSSWSWGWFGLGVAALVLVAVSGVLGALQPSARRGDSRYERSSNHSVDPWEQLSEGRDPTDQ